MKFFWHNRWIQLVIRLAIGAVFLIAGVLKLLNPQAFSDTVAAFGLIPEQLVNVIALGLPPFEILIGLLLISGIRIRAGALAVTGMSVIFAVVLSSALIRGVNIDCGCFGSGKPSVSKTWLSLGRDLLILVGSMAIFRSAAENAPVKRRPNVQDVAV